MLGRVTLGVLFLVLVWGNMVAGLKAGLACPDWPLCHGSVLPPWRWDIYMEFLHRVIAAVAALLLVLLSVHRLRSWRGPARAVPILAMLLLAAQVLMGGLVVLLEIPVQLTTVHFMAGILLFLLAFYMASFEGAADPPGFSFRGAPALLFGLGALVFLQAGLGAYVRHLQAGQACPDFPTCLGRWVPSFLSTGVMAHFTHRLAAVLILLTAAAVHFLLLRRSPQRGGREVGALLLAMLITQIGLGAMVVLSGLQFAVIAIHLAVALGILLALGHLWVEAVRSERRPASLPPR